MTWTCRAGTSWRSAAAVALAAAMSAMAPAAAGGAATRPGVEIRHEARGIVVTGAVQVTPTLLTVGDARPGGRYAVGAIIVRNRTAARATFLIDVQGATGSRDPMRRVEFLGKGEEGAGETAVQWVSPAADRVTLDSLELARIPVMVEVPPGAPPGGHYAAVSVQPAAAVSDEGTSVGIVSNIAIPVLVTVHGSAHVDFRLRNVSAPTVVRSRDGWTFTADVDNTGDVHMVPRGVVHVTNPWGGVVADLPIRGRLVLPGGRTPTFVSWKNVPLFGWYHLRIRTYPQGMPRQAHVIERSLVVMPPWWLWAGLGIAALAWGTRRMRRGRQLVDDDAGEVDEGDLVD